MCIQSYSLPFVRGCAHLSIAEIRRVRIFEGHLEKEKREERGENVISPQLCQPAVGPRASVAA